jgi:pimeloyl-ACP methyl ester carboxylesterase
LALAICRRLYAEGTLAELPGLLASVSRGESDQLEVWIKRQLPLALRIDGMPYLVDAASGASRERLDQIEQQRHASAFGNSMNFPFPQIGTAWQPLDLGEEYRLDPRSLLPAQFVSGELDWNTPVDQARRVAACFPNSTLRVVPGAVHETLMQNSTTLQCMATFLRNQDVSGS